MMEIVLSSIIWGVVWGILCNCVAHNKGIQGDLWFAWGFLFCFFALIVVATKPYNEVNTQNVDNNLNMIGGTTGILQKGWECTKCRHYNNSSSVVCICGQSRPGQNVRSVQQSVQQVVNGWKCRFCGRINAVYVGTCGCGRTKEESMLKNNNIQEVKSKSLEMNSKSEETKAGNEESKPKSEDTKISNQIENLELLKKYKELLDIGAITQEEFENKKKEIIG